MGVILALVRTRCGLLKCVAQLKHGVHEVFASVGAKCTPGGTCSDLDGGPYGRCRPPRRARKLVNESGQTREAEARNNLSQDGDAVYTHVQDAGERATQVLASRQECQEGR